MLSRGYNNMIETDRDLAVYYFTALELSSIWTVPLKLIRATQENPLDSIVSLLPRRLFDCYVFTVTTSVYGIAQSSQSTRPLRVFVLPEHLESLKVVSFWIRL